MMDVNKYYYCVNTFKDEKPIQRCGYVYAEDEERAILALIQDNIMCSRRYEFLDLCMVENKQ